MKPTVLVITTLSIWLLVGCNAASLRSLAVPTSGSSASSSVAPAPTARSRIPRPTESVTDSPRPTPTEPPRPTPRVPVPAFTGVPDARATREGVTIELWLSTNTVAFHDRLFVHVRVSNKGPRTVYRPIGGNCGNVASVTVDQRQLLPDGRPWTGIAATFKQTVLNERKYGESRFENVKLIDIGPYGCGDFFGLVGVKSGAVLDDTYAWDADGRFGNPLVHGPATITATFNYYLDRMHVERADERGISAATNVRIRDQTTGERPITDYIDLALSEDRFVDWLDNRPIRFWTNTSVSNWPRGQYPARPPYERATGGALDIGLFRETDDAGCEYGGVILDLPSGELLAVRIDPCCCG